MPQQALYLKWRSQTFDDVVGQEHVTRTLRNSIQIGRVRHAYLFSGPRGTGKTTMARLLAKAVNCTHDDLANRPCNECHNCIAVNEGRFLDLIEIDAASHTSVDDVRDLRDKIAFAPNEGQYKVYIIDEVHRFSGNAFDALLKTLEEPPSHAIFVLATTEIDKVPSTIKSRCLQFEFRRLSLQEISERLQYIAEQEGLGVDIGAIELIAREGTGSLRDSISLFDQIVVDPDETVTLEIAQQVLGTASSESVFELVDAIALRDTPRGLHMINQAIDAGTDPKQFGQQVVEQLRYVLLTQTSSEDLVDASSDDQAAYRSWAQEFDRSSLLKTIRLFHASVNDYTAGWQPQLALELALIEATQTPEEVQFVQQLPARQQSQPSPQNQAQNQPDSSPENERVEPTQPGEPPIIDPTAIQEKWVDFQTAVHRYNRNLPAMLDHAHIRTVDGNRLILGVGQPIWIEKLTDPNRVQILERALFDLFQERLRVEVILADESTTKAPSDVEDDDPLIELGRELGGTIISDDS